MATLLNKSIYYNTIARVAMLGLMAFCGASSPALAQDTIAGKFKLTENTRFGGKMLPAGAYTFSIEPTGILQSVNSIQGAREVVQVIVRPGAKAGPVTAIFAMASRSGHSLDSSKLVLEPVNNGMAMRSMYLDQHGLVLDFDWWSPKNRTQMVAQAVRPGASSSSKSTD